MALRWYSTVVDCRDHRAQAHWWAQALGWTVFFESDEEAVVVPQWASLERLRATPWEEVPPGLVFVPVPDGKQVKNRLHLDLAPNLSDDREVEIEQLLAMGARRVDVGQSPEVPWEVLADPEGNEFCVLSSREV